MVSPKPKPTASLFEFHLETRSQCAATGQVKYSKKGDDSLCNIWEMRIPVEEAASVRSVCSIGVEEGEEGGEEGGESKKMKLGDNEELGVVPFDACLHENLTKEHEEEVLRTNGQNAQTVKRTVKFRSFPKYLVVKLSRYGQVTYRMRV